MKKQLGRPRARADALRLGYAGAKAIMGARGVGGGTTVGAPCWGHPSLPMRNLGVVTPQDPEY